jgi:hypothetical protein
MRTRTASPAQFTDLTVTGTGEDIAALTFVARRAGVLVHRSAPRPAGPGDPRQHATFRLRLHR